MQPKLIKTQAGHEAALARIEAIFEAVPGTPEGDEFELLATLVELYEKERFPVGLPDPVAAIRFRMEQGGLKQKDLARYIGSESKVSEVLSGQRGLSLSMIRSLAAGLGIPAEVLLQEPGAKLDPKDPALQWDQFPLAEMVKRGWFPGFHGRLADARAQAEDLLAAFAAPLGRDALHAALNRQQVRSGSQMDPGALAAWRIRAATLAIRETLPAYQPGAITPEFMRSLVQLSYLDQGPRLAKEFLGKNGIHFVVERHLPRTFLDGMAMKLPDASPLVALTLRFDRLDHFWFTLCHELAHVALHLDQGDLDVFFDEVGERHADRREQEADQFANESLIPAKEWKTARLSGSDAAGAVRAFAARLRISPAIPAGRIRHERGNFKLLQDLVGNGKVRKLLEPSAS